MKRILKKWVFKSLELLFVAIIPLVIIYVGYGGWGATATKFKWYFGALLAVLAVLFLVKKVWLNPWIDKRKIKTANLETDLETEVDQAKILYIEDALRRARLIETVINWIMPIILLVLALMAFRAVERSIVTFAGIIGWVLVSEVLGFVVSIFDALSVHSKHKGE